MTSDYLVSVSSLASILHDQAACALDGAALN